MKKNILVTGGAGYIGSHTVVELLNQGENVTILDNFSNSKPEVIHRIEKITGCRPLVEVGDVTDARRLDEVFQKGNFSDVIHFAGKKAVGESVREPLEYYRNNVGGTVALLQCMKKFGVNRFVFSSSATVYGEPDSVPVKEDFPLRATNPYGQTKLTVERLLQDVSAADPEFKVAILRYFNPIGAHESGLIGEDPNGIPNNLLPYVAQVAVGKREKISVFGKDYPTRDGTGIRDYIHVTDLAKGHLCALKKLEEPVRSVVYNLGTGQGYSVLEVIQAFSKACGKDLPFEFTARRSGDIAVCYADASKAKAEMGFCCRYGLEEMCRDHWNWQKNNPNGYDGE